MGEFRKLFERYRADDKSDRPETLERRVEVLEEMARHNRQLLLRLIAILERRFGEELDDEDHLGSRLL